MKTLQEILHANYGDFMSKDQLPELTEGTIICAIMDNGVPVFCTPRFSKGITCPMCGFDEGYKVNDPGGYWWACRRNECIQKNAKRVEYTPPKANIEECLTKIGVPERLLSASFDSWLHSESLKSELISYSRNPKEFYVFIGKNGIGKSYSASAIIREYFERNGEYPLFYNVSSLYQEWLSNVKSPLKLMYKLTRTPLLVLDDLGTRTPSEAFCDFIYLVVNSRYSDRKGTVVTTNMDVNELEDKFGKAIVSRLFRGEYIEMEGEDLRSTRS